MSLVDEVSAQIRTTIADLGYLNTQLATALHDIEHARHGFAQASRGTTTDQLPQAVAACAEAAERLAAATTVVDSARELLWNYLLVITPSVAGPRPTAFPPTPIRDRHGILTDGVYSVNDVKNRPHAYETRQEGKSYFNEGTDLGRLSLEAAAIADQDGLWRSDIPGEFARKAKVRFGRSVGIHQRTGRPTYVVNVMRRKTGTIHISPGSADDD